MLCSDGTFSNTVIAVMWKVENALSDIAKEISRQNFEGAAWFLLAAYGKM